MLVRLEKIKCCAPCRALRGALGGTSADAVGGIAFAERHPCPPIRQNRSGPLAVLIAALPAIALSLVAVAFQHRWQGMGVVERLDGFGQLGRQFEGSAKRGLHRIFLRFLIGRHAGNRLQFGQVQGTALDYSHGERRSGLVAGQVEQAGGSEFRAVAHPGQFALGGYNGRQERVHVVGQGEGPGKGQNGPVARFRLSVAMGGPKHRRKPPYSQKIGHCVHGRGHLPRVVGRFHVQGYQGP